MLEHGPRRIVSLLPGATEIVFALGLGERLVGVSHECDHPSAARELPVLSAARVDARRSSADIDRAVRTLAESGASLYRLDEERLRALRPDLILTQDTCAVCALALDEVRAAVARIAGLTCEIVALAPATLDDVFGDILRVARAAGVEARGQALVLELRARLAALARTTASLPHPRVLALEWLAPPMVAGHWTPELLRCAGADPILAHDGTPTSAAAWEEIAAAEPEFVLLFPCGFTPEQTRSELSELARQPIYAQLPAVRAGRVAILDGNAYFNRPGPRLVEGAELAARALHPASFD